MLEIEKLGMQFGDNVLYENIDLSFKKNGFYAICGESGCGKTTLLNIINGTLNQTSGYVIYDGDCITGKRKDTFILKNITYITQEPFLIEHLTVMDNALLSLKLINKHKSRDEIKRVLESFDLYDTENMKASVLSGGEKQRVCFAIAVLKETPIILADEPTASLDEENAMIIFENLKELSKKHLIIVSSHEVGMLNEFCDCIYEVRDKNFNLIKNDLNQDSLLAEPSNVTIRQNLFWIYNKLYFKQIIKKIFLIIITAILIGLGSFYMGNTKFNYSIFNLNSLSTSDSKKIILPFEENELTSKSNIEYDALVVQNSIINFNKLVDRIPNNIYQRNPFSYRINDYSMAIGEIQISEYQALYLIDNGYVNASSIDEVVGKEISPKSGIINLKITSIIPNNYEYKESMNESNLYIGFSSSEQKYGIYYNYFTYRMNPASFYDISLYINENFVMMEATKVFPSDEVNNNEIILSDDAFYNIYGQDAIIDNYIGKSITLNVTFSFQGYSTGSLNYQQIKESKEFIIKEVRSGEIELFESFCMYSYDILRECLLNFWENFDKSDANLDINEINDGYFLIDLNNVESYSEKLNYFSQNNLLYYFPGILNNMDVNTSIQDIQEGLSSYIIFILVVSCVIIFAINIMNSKLNQRITTKLEIQGFRGKKNYAILLIDNIINWPFMFFASIGLAKLAFSYFNNHVKQQYDIVIDTFNYSLKNNLIVGTATILLITLLNIALYAAFNCWNKRTIKQ